jgi:hypothetical protein
MTGEQDAGQVVAELSTIEIGTESAGESVLAVSIASPLPAQGSRLPTAGPAIMIPFAHCTLPIGPNVIRSVSRIVPQTVDGVSYQVAIRRRRPRTTAASRCAAAGPIFPRPMTDELQRLQTALAGRYRVERVVGRGGMATVYLAADERHRRNVAIKVVRPDLAAVLGADRFLHEIRVTANLAHPHILSLHDSGVADGLLYYVMPFVVGESLRARLNREGTLSLPDTLAIATDVADALSYAHRQDVVHRDMKPENVLLSEGHALVTDFGIAKAVSSASDEPLTRTGVAIGTPGYMSPEQAAGGDDVNQQTVVYSLACVIYEMLMGSVPSRWLSYEEWAERRFLRAPPAQRARLSELPDGVERTLVRAMAIDPGRRPASPNELVSALTTASPRARRYSGTEAREILNRAASLEAVEPEGTAGFSLTGVKRIAGEVGIPSRHVMAAADALEQPVAEPS